MCILLVEDEWIVLAEMAQALEDESYEVMTAIDGAEALALARTSGTRLTCLVTDLNLPGLVSGKHLVEEMRASHPAIPIIVATAQAKTVSPDWMKQYRIHLLSKPYLADELLTALRKLLGRPGQ